MVRTGRVHCEVFSAFVGSPCGYREAKQAPIFAVAIDAGEVHQTIDAR